MQPRFLGYPGLNDDAEERTIRFESDGDLSNFFPFFTQFGEIVKMTTAGSTKGRTGRVVFRTVDQAKRAMVANGQKFQGFQIRFLNVPISQPEVQGNEEELQNVKAAVMAIIRKHCPTVQVNLIEDQITALYYKKLLCQEAQKERINFGRQRPISRNNRD